MTERLLSHAELRKLKGVGYTSDHLLKLEKLKKFPPRVKLYPGRGGRVAWRETEVDAWIADRSAERLKQQA